MFSLLGFFSAVVLLLRWRRKTYLKRRPLFRLQIFSVSKCYDIQARIWLAICEFLWLLTNQNVWLVTLLHLFCIELPENCIYFSQSELSNFFMYIISSVINSKSYILPIQSDQNDSCVDPLDYRLVPTPPPVDEEGILRMYACDKHSSTSFSCHSFYNVECNRQPSHYPRRHHGPCSSRKRTAERGWVWWQRGNLLIFHSCLNM